MQSLALLRNVNGAIDIIVAEAATAMALAETDSEKHGWSMVCFETENIRERVRKLADRELWGEHDESQ